MSCNEQTGCDRGGVDGTELFVPALHPFLARCITLPVPASVLTSVPAEHQGADRHTANMETWALPPEIGLKNT